MDDTVAEALARKAVAEQSWWEINWNFHTIGAMWLSLLFYVASVIVVLLLIGLSRARRGLAQGDLVWWAERTAFATFIAGMLCFALGVWNGVRALSSSWQASPVPEAKRAEEMMAVAGVIACRFTWFCAVALAGLAVAMVLHGLDGRRKPLPPADVGKPAP